MDLHLTQAADEAVVDEVRGALSVNPASGRTIEHFPYLSGPAVEQALNQAWQCFQDWRWTPVAERAAGLESLARGLEAHITPLAETITAEMGKPIAQAKAEVKKCAALCFWYAEHGPAMLADEETSVANGKAKIAWSPLGPILAVMPWNLPLWQVLRASVPILMAGNVVVLKPARNVTRCALNLQQLCAEVGLPVSLLSVLNISQTQVAEVIADRRIAAVTVTGSVAAGAAVAAQAGRALKKSVLELGGSDPFIVLADADLDAAVDAALLSRFLNTGQVCIAAKRLLVERSIVAAFTEKLVSRVKALKLGDPRDPDSFLGPLARSDLRSALHQQVHSSLEQGARLLCGGRAMAGEGFFYAATVLADVVPGMAVFDEETFGPVAAITQVSDAEEAIGLANHSDYGLSAALWTRDLDRAQTLARRLETGAVFINGYSASDPKVPIGGVKNSGYGRELSYFGLREFCNPKTIWEGRR